MIGFMKLKNISDKDAVFLYEGTQYEVKKGASELFPTLVAKHGIRKTIVQEDWVTGDFNSQLVEDDGSYDGAEELKTNVLSSNPHATEAVTVDNVVPGGLQKIEKNVLPPSPKVEEPVKTIQQPRLNMGGNSASSDK